MPDTYTNGDLVDIIENESLGYAVQHYLGAEHIEDRETAKLWKAADEALGALVKRLERQTGREVAG